MSEHPIVRIVRGQPTPEELAAVTALVTAAAGDEDGGRPAPLRGPWSDPTSRLRRPMLPGPGAWRAAAQR